METILVVLLGACATAYLLWRRKERRTGPFADRLCPHCRRAIRASAAVCPHCSQRLAEPRPSSSGVPRLDAPPPGPPRAPGAEAGPGGGAAFVGGALAGVLWPRRDGDSGAPDSGGPAGLDDEVLHAGELGGARDADVRFMRDLGELDDLHDAGDDDDLVWEEEEDEDDVDERKEERFDYDLLVEEMEDLDLW